MRGDTLPRTPGEFWTHCLTFITLSAVPQIPVISLIRLASSIRHRNLKMRSHTTLFLATLAAVLGKFHLDPSADTDPAPLTAPPSLPQS